MKRGRGTMGSKKNGVRRYKKGKGGRVKKGIRRKYRETWKEGKERR